MFHTVRANISRPNVRIAVNLQFGAPDVRSEGVMIGDRLSNDIRPARLPGSNTIRVAQKVCAVSVAAGFLRRSRSDGERSCRAGARTE
jgi:predicted HAD superfamily phosphohydrolase YqeG